MLTKKPSIKRTCHKMSSVHKGKSGAVRVRTGVRAGGKLEHGENMSHYLA